MDLQSSLPHQRLWLERHNRGEQTFAGSCLRDQEGQQVRERYKELQELISLRSFDFWHFDKFWAEALAQQGKIDEAITFAESRRHDRSEYDAPGIAEFCERVLLEADRREEAYQRFGLEVSRATTNLATYRRIVKKYPEREPRQIALDLIAAFGPPGKWFAAAKDAGFLDLALECARDVDADPSTLIRAARDFTEDAPEFAAPVALLALEHLLAGHGYEPMPLDVMQAHRHLMAAAGKAGSIPSARTAVERLIQTKSASANEPLRRVLEAVHRRSARH